MMNLSHEYKAQIILGSLQSLIILFGSLLVGIFKKPGATTPPSMSFP
ncbi:MAG: hypothetical protein P1U90_04860 [Akkermansiaceae bacterium]|nr:hypothetical protein [Akkermansiaceae bacterium]